ncbi:MAG: GvpL/GvpF family gas vesicle protein, partial [Candidatus Rokubacteria bacterium]|nr:GvpL/GvpF family gas vesicle protein [Candidatus Rokubacteria bacterium]
SAGIARALLEHAVEFREREVVSGGAPDEAGARILNWAFLVPRSRVDDFRARIQRINAEHAPHGLVLDLSGPWPPYSFCPSLEPEPVA